ncbi:MAG: hypothetical protein K6B45_06170 [Bacteroidaceae bacterium]|nr:hypothetical protein [Bacteroidaceae bacterium]
MYTCENTIRRVFGGGNAAEALGVVTRIDGGRFDWVFGGGNGEGGHAADIGTGGTNLTVNSGIINHLFGGSNELGTIKGTMGVVVDNTGCVEDIKEFFAGGNLAVIGTSENRVTLSTTISCGTNFGAVYGGSNLADIYGDITLTINGGTIGEVYAGSKGVAAGDATYSGGKAANIYGSTTLNIYAGDIDRAFGGSNINGNITGSITVNMDWSQSNCSEKSITDVFGASNLATYTPTTPGSYPQVNIKHGTVSGSVFGAGNGVAGDPDKGVVTSNPVVTIGDAVASHSAVVTGNVYGGGNNAGVTGNTSVTYNDNNASSTVAKLFGGGNAAGVSGTSTITLTSGKVTAGVYGGCNASGSVGAVTVALNGGTVGATGAGNEADVYGGGFGHPTTTTGNVTVTLGNTTVYGNIYGGSALGQVNASTSNTTTLTINGGNLHGSIFGGGMGSGTGDDTRATTNGNVQINYNTANTNLTGLYGGANVNGSIVGNIEVNVKANVGTSTSATLDVFGGGYGAATATSGNVVVNMGDNTNTSRPVIYGAVYGGSALGQVNATNSTTTVNILSGTLHGNVYGGGLGEANVYSGETLVTDNSDKGQVNGAVIVNIGETDGAQTPTYTGYATIDGSVYGCNNTNGSPKGNVTVNIYQTAHDAKNAASYTGNDATYAIANVFGGGRQADFSPTDQTSRATVHVHGCNNTIEDLFGGGDAADAYGLVTIVDGGRFNRVFGGGNGEVTAANIGAGGTNLQIHGGKINQLFGGSNERGTISGNMGVSVDADGPCAESMYVSEFFCGNNLANIGAEGEGNSVNINATIGCGTKFGDVYGGCNLADIYGNVTLTIEGGEMNNVYGGSKGSSSKAANITGNVALNIFGGKIAQDAFGGSNVNGNITGTITVTMDWSQASSGCNTDLHVTNVFGASNQAAYTPSFTPASGTERLSPAVIIKHGTVSGSVFGGGKGSTATVTSNPVVTIGDADNLNNDNIKATITGDVYGGGDAGDVVGVPQVNVINKCNTSISGDVYGGGNAADVEGTLVTIDGGKVTGMVFGGGHGDKDATPQKEANVNGDVEVNITGGTIGKVFGGSNSKGAISGAVAVNIDKGDSSCDMHITEVYGGGNQAAGNAGTITIGCTGGATEGIGDVYGGAREADINSDIVLNITGGKIANVFGGNNIDGSISGGIEVNVNWDGSCAQNSVQNVYGGGNLAQYTIPSGKALAVNILNGTVTQNVYGGGKGDPADHSKGQVTGNPVVTIGDVTNLSNSNIQAVVTGDVYGGGDAGDVVGVPQVNVINKCNTSIANVYGGGNAADVKGTDVNIDGGNITGMVFGGGHGDKNASPQKEANVDGNVAVDITGGTINKVFGGSNSKGDISGSVAVNIAKGDNSCDMHIAEVYGGGNEADGNAGTISIGCTGDYDANGEGIGSVYGGANAADVGNNINLTIQGGHINNVYGGNNTSGDISGTITVTVNWDDVLTCGKYLGNVFGGGNQAVYTAPTGSANYPAVNIRKGTVSGDVFGGGYGNASDATKGVVTGNPQVTVDGAQAAVTGGVYGGGSLAPTNGNPTVTLTNGFLTNVYGGGKAAGITGAPTVNINGGTVSTGVYGGCDASGTVDGNIVVTVTAGTVGTSASKANVHGGGFGSATGTTGDVTVNIGSISGTTTSGTAVIYGDVYGGSALGNVNSDTNDKALVNLNSGTIYGDAYGGGLGDTSNAALVNGNVTVTQNGVAFIKGVATEKNADGSDIVNAGRIFGCNNLNGSPKGTVLVLVKMTTPISPATSHVYGNYEMAAVYGGGNLAPYQPTNPQATGPYITGGHDATKKPVQVVIDGCDEVSIEFVYGGGNAAATPATDVVVLGAFELGNVFGGGNGKDKITYDGTTWSNNEGADVGVVNNTNYGSGESTVTITGGKIHGAFGGSNTLGDVVTNATVNLNEGDVCDLEVDEVYGGGNEAIMHGGGNIVLGCITYLKEIYGGAKQADVGNSVSLTITSGHFDRVFGGNNLGGTIHGSITVNIEETGCKPITIGELYGCGNNASYTTPSGYAQPTINIKSFTSIGRVFGGGLGADATVTGNPIININEAIGEKASATTSEAGSTITLSDGSKVTLPAHTAGEMGSIGTVFGGGNAANVNGDTYVNIGTASTIDYVSIVEGETAARTGMAVKGANITGNVYGGGNAADVTGKTNVTIGQP